MNIDESLKWIADTRKRIDSAKIKQSELEGAKGQLLKQLKEDFGIDSYESLVDAEAVLNKTLTRLEDQLSDEISKLKLAMDAGDESN